jgi:cytochrome c553
MRRIIYTLAAAALLAACGGEEPPVEASPDVAAGERFAEEHCTACHGLDGGGRTAEIPNLAGQPAAYLEEAMQAYHSGQRRHAALQSLIEECSAEDIRNIAAYFAGLPPVSAVAAGVEPAEAVYDEGRDTAAACARCHGAGGFSETPGVPSLAGQHPIYLIVATQEYASGARDNAEKELMLGGLDDIDIEKMAMYFAAQAPSRRDPPPFGDVAAGEAQAAVCGACHGPRGHSDDPMVPNLAGQEPHYLVAAIRAYRDEDRSHEDMVADKSDDEIEDIAAYYAVQQASPVIEPGAETAAIIAKCERCHGPAAGPNAMAVPSLRGQQRDYLLRVLRQYRDGERGSSMMHKMSASYSDRVLTEIADYYTTHPRSE